LDKLTRLWSAFREAEPALDRHLQQWTKDYRICYGLPLPETSEKQDDLLTWSLSSSYDVQKSRFYQDGNQTIMSDCFAWVMQALRVSGACLSVGEYSTVRWRPFSRTLATCALPQRDRVAELPCGEVYTCKDGLWTVRLFIPDTRMKAFAGTLIKKVEACLRDAARYPYRLSPEPFEFSDLIDRAVKDFIADRTRTVVTVDRSALTRIRAEALSTQEKLAAEEDLPVMPPSEEGVSPAGGGGNIETRALTALLNGEKPLREFAAQHGLMPEVLADSINESAVDYFGDSLLNDDFELYEEYRLNAEEMVGLV
jgi:hypothetical protein